jgi:hypothetical protein
MTAHRSHTIADLYCFGYGRCGLIAVWNMSAVPTGAASSFFPLFVIMGNCLTVAEKEHWKNRITKRIDAQIDAICSEAPEFMAEVNQAAKARALESLGIADLQRRLDRFEHQEEVLEAKREKTYREMLAHIRGVPSRQLPDVSRYGSDAEIADAVSKRQSVHEQDLLRETLRGRRILVLREEKDNLLDTVWLATSPKQIKDLWRKVNDLLGGEQTKLQQDALEIEPVVENQSS